MNPGRRTKQIAFAIPCPNCGAKVGEHCAPAEQPIYLPCCLARWRARPIPRAEFFLKAVIDPGAHPSFNCLQGQHPSCSGRLQRKYGLPGLNCTCACHRGKHHA
jgi:hypothetical protein